MKFKEYSIKDRLVDLVERYEELIKSGAYSDSEFLYDMDQIDTVLPEDISYGKEAESAIEKAWYAFSGEYELISVIVDKVKAMMSSIVPDPVEVDGQYSFVFTGGEIALPRVA